MSIHAFTNKTLLSIVAVCLFSISTLAQSQDKTRRNDTLKKPESTIVQKPVSKASTPGVPSQNWSLFGNSNSDPSVDKLGTTDNKDLVIVTNNLDRFRVAADGDINLGKSLDVGFDLRVNRNVFLNILGGETVNNGNFTVDNQSATFLTGALTTDGATNLNSFLNVNNAAPTRLTGALTTDGVTTLNSALNVNFAAPTRLTGTLTTDGATTLNNSLTVDDAAPTRLTGSLTTEGPTTLNGSLTVGEAANTHLTGSLDVDQSLNIAGPTTLQNKLNTNGQVTITANLTGGEGSSAAHPLIVQGSNQGIAIKLNPAIPNNSNNFVTFFNGVGSPVGRIEGQTSDEVINSPEFIYQNAYLVGTELTAIANTGAAAIPVAVGPCAPCLAVAAANLVLATANLAAYNVFALSNLGVTYESGSADYAEWLERNDPNEKISAAEIVGVNGGKISKFTFNAKQYMVVSTRPAMLGNMPAAGQSEFYEKVAFMGQVPVKVRGVVVIGDYILPSGFNDGTGIAVSQDAITAEQYREIVGVAWSPSFAADGISLVNMAIGLSSNDVANLTARQEKKLKALENKLNALEKRLLALQPGPGETSKAVTAVSTVEPEPAETSEPTRSQQLASSMPSELTNEVLEQAINYIKTVYISRGVSFQDHPALNRLFTDAAYKADVIRQTQAKYSAFYKSLIAQRKK